jgi:DNA (cytosine-5)-methyltransferase 1
MTPLTHFSLFSGIGGLDLAAEWAGFRTVGQVERDEYCRAVLARHWPNVPKFEDIQNVTIHTLREAGIEQPPTVLSGGFPCQPFSCAGKRRGTEDDRYLWPEMLRVVQQSRPSWVVGENVAGIISMALDGVCADLERAGYACRPFVFPAAGVGAPHIRNRVFIVAHTSSVRCEWGSERQRLGAPEERWLQKPLPGSADVAVPTCQLSHRAGKTRRRWDEPTDCGPMVSDPVRTGWKERLAPTIAATAGYGAGNGDPGHLSGWGGSMPSPVLEPGLRGVVDGFSAGMDDPFRVARLRALGNAVVPAQAYPIFAAIAAIETGAIA